MNAIFPGKFDPVHNGHVEIINEALKSYNKVYVVIMENPEVPAHNSIEQRLGWMKSIESDRIIIAYHDGLATEFFKMADTTTIIRGYRNKKDYEYEATKKERYMKQDKRTNFVLIEGKSSVSSTMIRDLISKGESIDKYVPWINTP